MLKFVSGLVCLSGLLIGAFFLGRGQQATSSPQACTTSTREDLQARIDALIRELKQKDAKLSDINELLLKLLLVELGLKVSHADLASLGQTDRPRASEPNLQTRHDSAATPTVPQHRISSGEERTSQSSPASSSSKIDSSYYKFKNKRLFGIPRLFNDKQAVPGESLETFKALNGHYIGLVTFADGTEGPIDMTFNQVKNESGQIERFNIAVVLKTASGKTIVSSTEVGSKAQLLTFGDDSVPSVGDVRTGYVIEGSHHFAIAWPMASPDKERSDGRMLEGYYYFKGTPSESTKGIESGSLYLFRK